MAASGVGNSSTSAHIRRSKAESLRRLGDLITEKCEETSIGAKIIKNLALPAPRPRPEPRPIAKTGELMLDTAMDKIP